MNEKIKVNANNIEARIPHPFLGKVKNMFAGRICRTDFYLAVILHGIIIISTGWLTVTAYIKMFTGVYGIGLLLFLVSPLLTFLCIFVFISLFSLIVRRLHDINVAGTKFFLSFIPLINIPFMLYLFLFPGIKGENLYGNDRSGDPFLDVIFNKPKNMFSGMHKAISEKSIGISRNRQIAALIVLILHVIFLFILI